MLEKHIEASVCDYAKEKGLLVYKFTSPNRSAVPDRLFICPEGLTFFIEFKRPGQVATPQQQREHVRLIKQMVNVFVIDNVDLGIAAIELMIDQDQDQC